MSRRQAPLQINEFSGGLNTEFNPLSMPPNISISELNMELTADGSRKKRLGFNYESGYVSVDTGAAYSSERSLVTSTFRWNNAGGDPEKSLTVVQVGNYIGIHNLNTDGALSDDLVYSEFLSTDTYETIFSYAVVDGLLVIVTGVKEISVYEYDGTTVTKTTDTLMIRDLFGVESDDLTAQNNLDERPTTLTDTHTYNLRNQTFYSPRYANNTETLVDPINAFYTASGNSKYPSNADNINYYLYADPNDSGDRLVERFFADNMVLTAPSVGESPKGHFIIDALERGTSREDKEQELRNRYPTLGHAISSLPQDKTPNGATVVEEFAGRVWFGGFSGQLIGGDLKSPRMSSYLLFSMLVKDKTDISQCYQRADPTSNEDSALVDTDGGFIRIDGAYGISNLLNLEGSLFVFGSNGVWRVSGGEGNSFSATSYQVDKLTVDGCISPNSVVAIGSQILYWGHKGIFSITRNQYGFWEVQDISTEKIKTFYNNLSDTERETCAGFYDTYDRKVRWVYGEASTSATGMGELVLDLEYGAYTPMAVDTVANGLPFVANITEGQPYAFVDVDAGVTRRGVDVTVSSVPVTVVVDQKATSSKQSIYLILTQYSPTIEYTFGLYRDTTFYDWSGENYDAYLTSGALTGGEARYRKQAPYLHVFFKRTEDGFDENLNPTNQSSCLLSSRWDWTTSSNTKKWSTPREAYRYTSLYFPEDEDDDFDTGETVIATRNKIRGIGMSVSFRFESVEGKNLHIHGWSFDLMANGVA